MDPRIRAAGQALATPSVYADEERLHQALGLLRRQAPVHWVDAPGYRPFWAVTRHADIMEIGRANRRFRNGPRPVLMPAAMERRAAAAEPGLRTLIHLDDPDHGPLRAVGADWFRTRALGDEVRGRIADIARRRVDRMAELRGACDIAVDVAHPFSLYSILSLLGLPDSDYRRILELTRRLRGSDPDAFLAAQAGLFRHFQAVATDRVSRPTEDLASYTAHARIDGERLSSGEAASFLVTIATAGHDTVASVVSGGLHALIDHPEQLDRLRDDPSVMPSAVNEMIRWVTPTKSFMRTATEDYDLREVTIRAGDAVLLSYASANRDESVYTDDPFRFDVTRSPNRHLSFGFGPHHCLGAALARMEIGAFFAELLPRLRRIELAGPPVLTAGTFVGGLRHLPVTYELNG
ncbi:cytochrome P450 [Streptomyces clavuligerus]|uniref:Cytochrome P450 n=1 Tax=Streptomyces clavuligerus TaxID=1901 RepID=E2Q0I5_STRCL|nr:cytochrome P450 [Streptomyces clavuligerus]ANW16946.1 cytochrome [Streptomyces clavuligerus]AXU11475.1 cytochrome P450 [Streptomyces clavuligerus]EFG10528.1 Cytochrome P450 [Streptomyces clavuligerus]MBY6301294.1 cytochrome P450 [Streptomyces clavuligerus]QCS04347.1 cytochrome P450 [Streptomyces clavuligerus]